jgi:hypothetical protein
MKRFSLAACINFLTRTKARSASKRRGGSSGSVVKSKWIPEHFRTAATSRQQHPFEPGTETIHHRPGRSALDIYRDFPLRVMIAVMSPDARAHEQLRSAA